ncbi:MAG: UDP-N-acetylmuramate--L-alanine ligase [Candidatus Vogelbacteria bacterium]|nr:UDP-N-acetylmuramate--L-alanine ligase [Candidatus Vogelbacteria bacterium]
MALDLSKVNKVHFIGIGGIGISAIARLFLQSGKQVTGSDQTLDSPVIAELKKRDAKIYHGQRARQVPRQVDLVIYSFAISEDNPERRAATRRGLPLLSYPAALGLLSQGKFTIAVAGTHGKTTTAAMLGTICRAAKLDPTVIVGSLMKAGKTNLWIGRSDYFIVEACEYRRSFLHLSPRILVITNIDNDHLDYYRDLADIQSAFAALAAKVPRGGKVITEKKYGQIKLPIRLLLSGRHNQRNAQAAIAAAKAVGVSERLARQALSKFRGTWRRFEAKGRTRRGALIYDDYAHHPTEIRATVQAARERFPKERLVLAFQPHLYSRTKLLFSDLAESLAAADEVLLLPIYAARERPDSAINSRLLAAAVSQAGTPTRYFGTFQTAEKYLNQQLSRGDLLLTLGAGDIFVLGEKLRYPH